MAATEPHPDLSAYTAGRTHDEAYRAMYLAFCIGRGLEVEINDDDRREAAARAWQALTSALAPACA